PALAKNWPASVRATLRAFLHPPAAVILDPSLRLSRDRDLARLRRASVLLPEAGLLFFACPKKSNQKKRHPGCRAFRAFGPPGTRAGCGVFRQGILPWRKTGPHPCWLSSDCRVTAT